MTTHHADDDTLTYIAKLEEQVNRYFAVAKNLEQQLKWKDEELARIKEAARAVVDSGRQHQCVEELDLSEYINALAEAIGETK